MTTGRRSAALGGAGLGLALCLLTGCGGTTSADAELLASLPPEPVTVEPVAAFVPVRTTKVARGDTIESVCRRLAGDDWVAWRDALVSELDPRRLRPGTPFEGEEQPPGRLQRLRVRLDLRTDLELERCASGVEVVRRERPLESEIATVSGTITSSLFGAVAEAGETPELAVRLAEIFQWDVDFFRDLRPGDAFTVVLERRLVDGALYDYGMVYAARFTNGSRHLHAIGYPDADGRLGYYDLEGRPLRKQFLRSPLKFSRVTSRFNLRRFHPVLKRTMPHYGVDYGAPTGTPVMATADGTVTFAGSKRGWGNAVTLRHPNAYETNYLHLSRFASGVRRGARVGQGDVIGYVGSTGLSTAPHLDYRVRHNGSWVNPLAITSPPANPIPEERRARFLGHALALTALLDGREPPPGAMG